MNAKSIGTLCALLLSLTALSPLAPAAQTCGSFPDLMQTDRACGAVSRLVQRQVVNGYPDGSFRPDNNLTRAEFAKLLVAALQVKPTPEATVPFPDAREHWASQMGYLQAAVQIGVLNGFPDGSFRPDAPVTRAQAVKIIVGAAGLRSIPARGSYSDTAGTWYEGSVAAAGEGGLIGAKAKHPIFDSAQFGGDEPATRAEAAMLLANLLNL